MNDEDLDRRLRAADRMDGVVIPEPVFDRVHREAQARAERSLRRRISAIAGLGVFSLGALTAAPSAAQVITEWLAVAEWQPEQGGEILPDSEMVDLSASDLPEYIASRFPEWLPIPPGTSKQQMIDVVVENWQNLPDSGFTQEVAFRWDFERLAYCGWIDTWLTSTDPGAIARSAEVIEDAPAWPAFNETDGGGTVAFLTVYADAAREGDRDGIEFAAWQYGCSSWDGDPRQWWVQQNGPQW